MDDGDEVQPQCVNKIDIRIIWREGRLRKGFLLKMGFELGLQGCQE